MLAIFICKGMIQEIKERILNGGSITQKEALALINIENKDELYEAATVDGANSWQKFRAITLPLLLFAITPLLIMTLAYNFNNFNIIYLLNDGGPAVFGWQGGAGGTDILISWVWKLTFEKLKYNYASAISIIIFIIISGFSIYNFRRTKSFQQEELLK